MNRLALGTALTMVCACTIDDGLRIDRDAYPLGDGGPIVGDGGALPDAAPDAEVLPRGGLAVLYRSAEPDAPLAAGTPHAFTVELYNQLTGSAEAEEAFDIVAELRCDSWTLDDVADEVVAETGGMATFRTEITPNADDDRCDLVVGASSRRNPNLGAAARLELALGEEPEVGTTLVLRHPRDGQGRLLVRDSALPLDGEPIQFTLANRSDEPVDYELEMFVTLPDGADTTGWPLEDDPQTRSVCCVEPGIRQDDIPLLGPGGALGRQGTLTLRLLDSEGGLGEELSQPFVVIESP